jgi:hypothetical protein
MKSVAIEDVATRRIDKITLEAQTFQDQMALTYLQHAIQTGRPIQIEISDDESFRFSTTDQRQVEP